MHNVGNRRHPSRSIMIRPTWRDDTRLSCHMRPRSVSKRTTTDDLSHLTEALMCRRRPAVHPEVQERSFAGHTCPFVEVCGKSSRIFAKQRACRKTPNTSVVSKIRATWRNVCGTPPSPPQAERHPIGIETDEPPSVSVAPFFTESNWPQKSTVSGVATTAVESILAVVVHRYATCNAANPQQPKGTAARRSTGTERDTTRATPRVRNTTLEPRRTWRSTVTTTTRLELWNSSCAQYHTSNYNHISKNTYFVKASYQHVHN